MKRQIIITLLMGFSIGASAQAPYMEAAYKRYLKSEKELTSVYQQITKEYVKYPLFIKKLKLSQKAWLASREADLMMKFPEADTDLVQALYGTIYPLCANDFFTDYNNRRIKFLRQWSKSQKLESEECRGSIHNFLNKS